MSERVLSKSLFARRLREARLSAGIAQDKLGVMIGLDESCSSARMSRYENGIHDPAFEIVEKIAAALDLPVSYLFCEDDELAEILKIYHRSTANDKNKIFKAVINCLT